MRALVALTACLALGCGRRDAEVGKPIAGEEAPPRPAGGIEFDVPPGWRQVPPASQMRMAQYEVPDPEGQNPPAELAVFRFDDDAGGLEQNMERWKSQVRPDDPSLEPRQESLRTGEYQVTWMDLQGTYFDSFGKQHPDSRVLFAYVAAPDGTYVLKLVGPRNTVSQCVDQFVGLLRSLRPAR